MREKLQEVINFYRKLSLSGHNSDEIIEHIRKEGFSLGECSLIVRDVYDCSYGKVNELLSRNPVWYQQMCEDYDILEAALSNTELLAEFDIEFIDSPEHGLPQ